MTTKDIKVKSYTRKTKSGKSVIVRAHTAKRKCSDGNYKDCGSGDELLKKKSSTPSMEMLKMSGWDRVTIRERGAEKSYLVSPDGADMYPLKNMLPKKQRGDNTFSLHWSLPKGTKMHKVTPAVKKVIENSRG